MLYTIMIERTSQDKKVYKVNNKNYLSILSDNHKLFGIYNKSPMYLIIRYIKNNNKDVLKYIQKEKIFSNIDNKTLYLFINIVHKAIDVKNMLFNDFVNLLKEIDINLFLDNILCTGNFKLLKICKLLKNNNYDYEYEYEDDTLCPFTDYIDNFRPNWYQNKESFKYFLKYLKNDEVFTYFTFIKTHFISELCNEIITIELNDLLLISKRFDIISILLQNNFYSPKGIEKLFEIIIGCHIYYEDEKPMLDFLNILSKYHKNFFNFVYNNEYIDSILAWCILRINHTSLSYYMNIINYLLNNFEPKPTWTFKELDIEEVFEDISQSKFLDLLKLGMCPPNKENIQWFNTKFIEKWEFTRKFLEDLGNIPINKFTLHICETVNKFLNKK